MFQRPVPEETIEFDWTKFDSPATAVATAVAEKKGVEPVEIEPLFQVIDSGCLDRLLTHTPVRDSTPDCSVKFEYEDNWVIVNTDGKGYISDHR